MTPQNQLLLLAKASAAQAAAALQSVTSAGTAAVAATVTATATGLTDTKTLTEAAITANNDRELFVSNDDECVLLRIRPGKPNRKAAEPKRVTAPAQKGPSCFYYAMKVSAFLEEDYLKRQNEPDRKAASKYRKRWSALNYYQELKEWLVNFIVSDKADALSFMLASASKLDKKTQVITIARLMLQMGSKTTGEGAPTPLFIEQATAFINRFEKSKEKDILEFLKIAMKQDQVKAGISFLSDLGLNVNEECLAHAAKLNAKWALFTRDSVYYEGDNIYTMSLSNQLSLVHKTALKFLYKIFDLKPIDWSPLDNIDVLFNLIKVQKTPIEFGGFYGILSYNKPRVKVDENFEDYRIEGWPKGSHKGKDLAQETAFEGTHAISVIGVKKNKGAGKGQGHVYFLDPRIASEPNAPRIVLKMSYEQFCEYCMDDLGLNLLVNNNLDKSCSVPDGEWRGVLDYGYQRQRFAPAKVLPKTVLPLVVSEEVVRVDIVANPTPTMGSLVDVQIIPIVPAFNSHVKATGTSQDLKETEVSGKPVQPNKKITREEFNRLVEEGRQRAEAKAKAKAKSTAKK